MYHIRTKNKNDIIISIDKKKNTTMNKLQYPFVINNFQQTSNIRKIPQHKGHKWKAYSCVERQYCLSNPSFSDIPIKLAFSTNRNRKKIILTFLRNHIIPQIAKTILIKINKTGGIPLWFQNIL